MSDTVINSTYKIGAKLGAGSFGRIYSATNLKTQEEVAIKVEDLKSKAPQLLYEAKLYQCLLGDNPSAVEGIPRVYQCTTQSHYNLLVMDLLGPSLEDLFNLCGRQFSLKTVLMLAEQMLTRTEYVHGRSFLHRDIKPDNFLIGVGKKQSTVYIIDFGLSKKYNKDGRHIEFTEGKKLTGTARYASINTHKGFEQGRRDDLESLCYVWVYFLKGSLPWQGLKANDKQQRYEKIRDKKVEVSISELCEGLPAEFAEYMTYVRNLKFDEKPDYNRLHELFRGLMAKKNFTEDFEFDWVTKAREGKVRLSDARNIALEKKRENEGPMVINEDNLLFEKKSTSTFGINRNKKEDNNQRVIGESSLAVNMNSQIFKAGPTDLTTQGLGLKIASITSKDNETPHKQLKARV